MCKFCDLELNKRMNQYRDLCDADKPEEVNEYYKWMYKLSDDEGWQWHINKAGNVFLEMFNQGGYDSTVLECKFCPMCGNDMHKIALEYLKNNKETNND